MDMSFVSRDETAMVLGSRNDPLGITTLYAFLVYDGVRYRFDYAGSTAIDFTEDTAPGKRFTLTIDKNKAYFNDALVATRTYRDVVCSYPLMLFTANNGGTADERGAKMRLYSAKIYNNGTLQADLLPGSDGSGRATLYDSVGQKYLEPHGTFVMGETKVSNGWNKVKKVYVKEETGWMELSEMEYADYFGEKELYKLIKEENK